eukprot:scaffold226214_cov17-Tisochrysis_lutea.AAC.1
MLHLPSEDGCELELIDVGIDLEEGVKAVVDNASPASKCGRDAHNISVVYDSKVSREVGAAEKLELYQWGNSGLERRSEGGRMC